MNEINPSARCEVIIFILIEQKAYVLQLFQHKLKKKVAQEFPKQYFEAKMNVNYKAATKSLNLYYTY